MPRTLTLATVQMDIRPSSLEERLERAAALVQQAAAQGAQLVVLTEFFNTGYTYEETLYERAERADGPTFRWLLAQAQAHQVYVYAAWLVVDGDHAYDRGVLAAPDGQHWAYDKLYPWAWERAFFREGGHQIRVAHTPLGRIGLMICWDAAHEQLWRRYAGRVDLLLISSCPPNMHQMVIEFPDGARYPVNTGDHHFADSDLDAQAAWMGVPVVHAAGTGALNTLLPLPRQSLALLAIYNADLLRRLPQADQAVLQARCDHHAKIVDGGGHVLTRALSDDDEIAIATVTLPDETPRPDVRAEQPRFRISALSRLAIDQLSQALMSYAYGRGLRRQWGARMAPRDPRTWWWGISLGLAFIAGLWAARRR
ncbi:MAG: carbon-nitrogen hydrolase family protein [Anaerolineae bacterium]|nr:carbon-nitrogen hydrolase family protein [Anaerolineae bacterium]MDW8171763.1 carbon-nitrogen hydrolase family protein [Anaerolineae bacterium]